jgi:alkyl sulfatase BDS1-like metallo-beta-lactamase superfamily hydrolase
MFDAMVDGGLMQFWVQRRLLPAVLAAAILAIASTLSAQGFAGREKLRAHSAEFRKEVIKVADDVYVAVGYSLGNAILIQGNGGSIIVDTTSTVADARDVKAEFAKISTTPVRAIIYTHFHADHVGGASVFAGDDKPDVYSHQLLVDRAPDIGRAGRDGGNQFGSGLPESLYINAGIGPSIGRRTTGGAAVVAGAAAPPAAQNGFLAPTKTFAGDRLDVTVAGVRLVLLHTPGETSDAISVWLPDKRLLLPGDDFYRAFPNLYAIRGVRLRPVDQWIASLGKMLDLNPEYLVPSHTRPISGAANVRTALTAYRDGIKSVLDQTLEGMRKGERPDELVQHVKLPARLAENPYLQEFYGTVAWSVRAIYTDYLGWFDGNATHLFPLAEQERAKKIVALAGGTARVLAAARDAIAAGEFQWAAELADNLLAIDATSADARQLKAQALTELGERQISANARNYYLSSAQYLRR